jgi:peptidoglycan/xylan/chitin deacetylase (PgdA/CDA1 family)
VSLRRRAIAAVRRAGAPVGSVMRVRTDEPVVVATFDDGPSFRTAGVLTALADAGETATFFVLLTRVRRDPALLADIVAAGHEIALHGPDHRRLTTLPKESLAPRMRDARAELEDRSGRPVRWFRPPYGAQSLRSWRAVKAAGMEPVLWGPTLADWRDAPQEERLRLALSADRGAILLGHDGHADAVDGVDDGPAPDLDHGALLAQVIAGYAERGLRFTSLGRAAEKGRLVREARFRS